MACNIILEQQLKPFEITLLKIVWGKNTIILHKLDVLVCSGPSQLLARKNGFVYFGVFHGASTQF